MTSPSLSTPRLYSPSPPPPNTLLGLPRELRYMIYEYCLVSPSPIIAWRARWARTPSRELIRPFGLRRSRTIAPESRKGLTLSLLYCDHLISSEAAAIFYGRNTFAFQENHNWIPIISWLDTIGWENQRHLTSLSIETRSLPLAWQREDGTREMKPAMEWHPDELIPRSPYFAPRQGKYTPGPVECISPAVETLMMMLGRIDEGSPLTLHMEPSPNVVPGCPVSQGHKELFYMSMDLPNLMELWRSIYADGPNRRPVKVLWKVEEFEDEILSEMPRIKAHGWHIVQEEQIEMVRYTDYHDKIVPARRLVLQKKPLTGPLVESPPNPWLKSR